MVLVTMRALKADLHIHSQFSDGQLSVAQIVDLYGQKGYGAIAISDHLCESRGAIGFVSRRLRLSLTPEKFPFYMETLLREKERAMNEYGMLLIPGFEITKNSFINSHGAHVLILGSTEYIDPDLEVEKILHQAKSQNALTIAAHPFKTGDFEFQTLQLWERREELGQLIDLWEVNYRQRLFDHVLNSGLPLIASSDFHREAHFKSWKTKIFAKAEQEEVFRALRDQRIEFFFDEALPAASSAQAVI